MNEICQPDDDPPPVQENSPSEFQRDRRRRRDRYYKIAAGLLVSFWMVALVSYLLMTRLDSLAAIRRTVCKNNLRQIGLALETYHEMYGCFPPAYVADADGRPMHSWRVLIWPFLEAIPNYNGYRFDEPWDGPNNRLLHQTMPSAFRCLSENPKQGQKRFDTSYVVVIGKTTAWPVATSEKLSDITDGASNTLLVIEVADSGVHWMEPRDLSLGQSQVGINTKTRSTLAPSSRHTNGMHALMADGTVRFLRENLTQAQFDAMVTAIGGDDPGEF